MYINTPELTNEIIELANEYSKYKTNDEYHILSEFREFELLHLMKRKLFLFDIKKRLKYFRKELKRIREEIND